MGDLGALNVFIPRHRSRWRALLVADHHGGRNLVSTTRMYGESLHLSSNRPSRVYG